MTCKNNCEVEIDEVGEFFLHMLIDYLEIFFLIYAQNGLIQLTNKAYVKYQNFPLPFV